MYNDMNDKIDIINKIDYKTLKFFEKIINAVGFGTLFYAQSLDEYHKKLLSYFSIAFFVYGILLFRKKELTRDFCEVKMEYQEIIKNYNKMNKTFDFNDPIEIYTMYNHVLYNGYLSLNKKFEYCNKDNDMNSKLGINIITGQGVCRHISSLLTDILIDYGIEASSLVVYINKENEISLKDKKFLEILRILPNYIQEKQAEMYGNHAISCAFKDDKSYYLDSTNKFTGRINDNKIIVCDDYKFTPKLNMTKFINEKMQYLKLKQRLIDSNPSISKEEEKILTNKTINICDDNRDIFEKFYNENKEIYQEINAKVLKLKKLR